MKRSFKFKQKAAAAVIISVLCAAATVSVGAAGVAANLPDVYLNDDVTVVYNGDTVPLPDNFHILSYKGYNYMSVRYLSTLFAAKIGWNGASRTIAITPPAPVEKPAPPAPAPSESAPASPAPPPTTPAQYYTPAPAKQSYDNVAINVFGIVGSSDYTYINVDVGNNGNQQTMLDLANAYIEYQGVRYPAVSTYNQIWQSGIVFNQPVLNAQICFQKIPVDRPDQLKIFIPVNIIATNMTSAVTENFIFYVNFSNLDSNIQNENPNLLNSTKIQ